MRRYKTAPAIYNLSRQLTANLPQKAWVLEAKAIHQFVRDQIRYVKDIRGVETVQSPVQTLKIRQGDCDDKSTLVAALLESIGHPTRFVAVGHSPDRFIHVFVETKIGNRWFPVETTEPWNFGELRKVLPKRYPVHN